MSQENVELVRQGYDAFNSRDFDAATALMHDEVTWRPLFSVEADVLSGKNEIRAAWERQTEALDIRIEPLEVTALDDTRVLALGRWTGRGKGSGAPVEQLAFQLFELEYGRLRRAETFATRDEALDAAGPPAQDD